MPTDASECPDNAPGKVRFQIATNSHRYQIEKRSRSHAEIGRGAR